MKVHRNLNSFIYGNFTFIPVCFFKFFMYPSWQASMIQFSQICLLQIIKGKRLNISIYIWLPIWAMCRIWLISNIYLDFLTDFGDSSSKTLNLGPKNSQQSEISHKRRRFLYIFISIFVFRGCAQFRQNEKIKYKKEYSVAVFHFFYKRMLQNFERKEKRKEIFLPKFGLCFQFDIILKTTF